MCAFRSGNLKNLLGGKFSHVFTVVKVPIKSKKEFRNSFRNFSCGYIAQVQRDKHTGLCIVVSGQQKLQIP